MKINADTKNYEPPLKKILSSHCAEVADTVFHYTLEGSRLYDNTANMNAQQYAWGEKVQGYEMEWASTLLYKYTKEAKGFSRRHILAGWKLKVIQSY
jgi:hypothetical protein